MKGVCWYSKEVLRVAVPLNTATLFSRVSTATRSCVLSAVDVVVVAVVVVSESESVEQAFSEWPFT